ncbi:MAG: hypothetical protein F4137_25420 [Acidobacteria bacterium]|nr:hypothetical protein [Acidobacteriota bacterium]
MTARRGVTLVIAGAVLLALAATMPPLADPCAVLGEGVPCSPESIGFCYAEYTIRLPGMDDCIDVFLRADCTQECDRGLCAPPWAGECVSVF